MLLTTDRATSGGEWAGREFCAFGGFRFLSKYLTLTQPWEPDTRRRSDAATAGTGCFGLPDGYVRGECGGRGRVPERGWLRGGALGRAVCWSRGKAANLVMARQAPGAGPALCGPPPSSTPDPPCPGLCSRFAIQERTPRWELGGGGNVGVCCLRLVIYSLLFDFLNNFQLPETETELVLNSNNRLGW